MRYLSRRLLMLTTFTCFTAVALADEDCTKLIPSTGAFQLTTDNGTRKVYDTAKDMYCSNEWAEASRRSGWSFGIDVTGKGSGQAGSSNSTSSMSRAQFCSNKEREFSSSDVTALYRLQGDDTLVAGFIECMKTKRRVFEVTGSSVGDDATVVITPNLSQNAIERVISVGILSGAMAKDGVAIAPGTPLIGTSPVVGGYTLTAPQATFVIRTSTGDVPLVIRRCRTGTPAGTYEVKATSFTKELQRVGTKVWNVPAPQAGCHPNCTLAPPPDPAGGDVQVVYLTDPAILKNPRLNGCTGAGCPYQDSISTTLLDEHQVRFEFRARSAATTMHVTADTYSEATVGVEKSVASGSIVWGVPFSVQIPKDVGDAYLTVNSVVYPLEKLTDGVPFTVVAGKTPVGNNHVWTLRLDDVCK